MSIQEHMELDAFFSEFDMPVRYLFIMSLLAVMTMFLTTVMVVFLLYFLYDLY
jgi:hypothetical protein